MRFRLSLTQRYLLFVAVTIALLFVGSLVITSSVIRTQLTAELRSRLERSQTVLDQYAEVHYFSQTQKLEALTSSPRFIATVATADSATIAEQTPAILAQTASSYLVIRDPDGRILYQSDSLLRLDTYTSGSDSTGSRLRVSYIAQGGGVDEIISSDIVTSDNVLLGSITVGSRFSDRFVEELRRVTDFDVILCQNGLPIGMSRSDIVTRVVAASWATSSVFTHDTPSMIEFDREEIMVVSIPTRYSGTTITFVASVDERLTPIVSSIRVWLIVLAVLSGLVAMAAISWYTQRYIGSQINQLVAATSRISTGDLQTALQPQSQDELGQLAASVERMRTSLLEGREELEKAHQANLSSERHATIGKLAAGIIHDFKNPMAVIKGSAELIESRSNDSAKVVAYGKRISQQVDLMVELTRDVLEYSSGNARLDLAPVSLASYLSDVVSFHAHQFQEAEVGLRLVEATDVSVPLDAARLKRVLDNILTNAREACSAGSRVEMRWHQHDDGVVIEIEDNGPGIPPEIAATLFDPFVTSGKANGTGLGLAIAKKIVNDHGGEITVASISGVGTTFLLSLPVATPTAVHTYLMTTRR